MHEQIRRTDNGAIDYDFYRDRARAERRDARSAAIKVVTRIFHRIASQSFSFQIAAAHV